MCAKKTSKGNSKQKRRIVEIAGKEIMLILITAIVTVVLTLVGQHTYKILTTQNPNTRVYVHQIDNGLAIMAQNNGKKFDRVTIRVSTLPEVITDYSIRRGGQIRLIEGGPIGTYAVFVIDALAPGTTQAITIISKAKEPHELIAWSEYTGDIKDISKTSLKVEWGPEESYEEWQKKQ